MLTWISIAGLTLIVAAALPVLLAGLLLAVLGVRAAIDDTLERVRERVRGRRG